MRRMLVLAVMGLLVTSAAAAGATLTKAPSKTSDRVAVDDRAPGGWKRFVAENFTAAPGTRCAFELRGTVLFDREYIRTTVRFANGKPRVQEIVGPLVVRYTNSASGAAVTRDLSARGVVRYFPDGSSNLRLQGPGGVGFGAGDGLPAGFYVFRGEHVVNFDSDGRRTVVRARGSRENLCQTLQQ